MPQAALDIVATVREPLPLTLAFVAHHLAQGIRRLHLYFDDPDDPAIGLLSGLRQVRVTICDPAYWRLVGGRPAMIVGRQAVNAQVCQFHARSPWLLHCDADEFLVQARYVIRQLALLPATTDVLRLPVWERCLVAGAPRGQVFDGACRGPVLDPVAVYGPALAARLTRGMAAYAGCKAITRVSAGLVIGIHDSYRRGPDSAADRRNPVQRRMLHRMQIVHVDGLTARHAQAKMIDRGQDIPTARREAVMSVARAAQIAALTGGEVEAEAYFATLRTVDAAAHAALLARGAIMPMPVDPAAAAIRRWPRIAPLFDPASFDRILALQAGAPDRRSA